MKQAVTARAVVVGGGTMGADVAVVLARGGCLATVVESSAGRREALPAQMREGLAAFEVAERVELLTVVASLDDIDWSGIDVVIECIPERLELKQALFADLLRRARPDALLTSNSSSFPISAIGAGLAGGPRLLGLHFFMPAHLVPLVEVIMGPDTGEAEAQRLRVLMRTCGMVPVLVRKDLPGFLANRLQHALAREAFALLDDEVASAEDIDAAVRYGFGFRFLAAGPILQRDHAGLEVHTAAAATMYPSLAANREPARALRERVAAGQLGMKSGQGFFSWTPETIAAEKARYNRLLRAGLDLLADELPRPGAPEGKSGG